jgi:ATP-dependent exoDNAse (exonuclease V) beta subunit
MEMKKFTYNLKKIDEAKSVEENGKRFYLTPDGKRYPSVTTVVGFEKNKFFAEWRKKNPKESQRVTARGTALHSLVERYMEGKGVDATTTDSNGLVDENLSATVLDLFEQMRPYIDRRIDNVVAQETPLWSDLLELAGRVDLISDYDGKLSIVDFKGSTKAKKPEDIENYFLQATAYAIMWQERTGIPVKQIVILISTEEGIVQEFIEDPKDWVPKLREAINLWQSQSCLHQ